MGPAHLPEEHKRPVRSFHTSTGIAVLISSSTAGALGLGLPAASGITLTFSFLSYVLPILAGMLADARWGMFKTIVVSSFIGIVGTSSRLPSANNNN